MCEKHSCKINLDCWKKNSICDKTITVVIQKTFSKIEKDDHFLANWLSQKLIVP